MQAIPKLGMVLLAALLCLFSGMALRAQDFNPFRVPGSDRPSSPRLIEYQKARDTGKSLFGVHPDWRESQLGIPMGRYAGTFGTRDGSQVQVGDWGYYRNPMIVVQKLDGKTLLVNLQWSGRLAFLQGLDFSKVSDGLEFVLYRPVAVTGTRSYENTAGAKTTALVIDATFEAVMKLMPPDNREFRTWTTTKGKTLEGTFVKRKGNKVTIESKDGAEVALSFASLSPTDRKYVYNQAHVRKTAKTKPSKQTSGVSVVSNHASPAIVNEPPASKATTASAKETTEPDRLRTRYINATYHGVIRLRDGRWEAVDQTGKAYSTYEYVGRTNDYVELIDRGMPTRLYADHIDQKLNGKWSRVADGHWEK